MNGREVQVALQDVTTEAVQWTASGEVGSVYIGSEDNVDAVIVIGPFLADPGAEVDAVDVGLNGAEEQERHTETEAVVGAVARLLAGSR